MSSGDDIERIAQRLLIYAPREISRKKLKEVKEDYRRKLGRISALEKRRLRCPECGKRKGVIITGNGKQPGTKKFLCSYGEAVFNLYLMRGAGGLPGVHRRSSYSLYHLQWNPAWNQQLSRHFQASD